MKTRILPRYGNTYDRQRGKHNRRSAVVGLLAILVGLIFVCLYQWMAQRNMTEMTNRALLRQDSLEAVKLSQDKVIFLMKDTIHQLRQANLHLQQQQFTLKKSGK
jgi:hypothetical protein